MKLIDIILEIKAKPSVGLDQIIKSCLDVIDRYQKFENIFGKKAYQFTYKDLPNSWGNYVIEGTSEDNYKFLVIITVNAYGSHDVKMGVRSGQEAIKLIRSKGEIF